MSSELKSMVDVVLDGGQTIQGTPSTVADLTKEKPKILRDGPISLKALLDALAFGD
jgi:tRNA A37 threonylcarbamoyladenosine synthetase subunit TsaC/SUA5/YrdC